MYDIYQKQIFESFTLNMFLLILQEFGYENFIFAENVHIFFRSARVFNKVYYIIRMKIIIIIIVIIIIIIIIIKCAENDKNVNFSCL